MGEKNTRRGLAGKLSAYVRLFRIEHAFLLSFAVLIAELLASSAASVPMPPLPMLLISLAVPFLIEMGSFALNDYLDEQADHENRRADRPLVSGEIEATEALAAAAASYIAGVFIAVGLPLPAFAIAAVFAVLSVLYNWKLKDFPLLGNIYIACTMAIPFLFGNLIATGSLYFPVVLIAAVAFVSGLGREIVKSAEDIEGDVKHRKSQTLPVLVGKKNACLFAAALYLLLVPLAFLPFAYGLKATLPSLGLVAVTAAAFAAQAFSVAGKQDKESLKAARKGSLLALGIGLIGYAASLI